MQIIPNLSIPNINFQISYKPNPLIFFACIFIALIFATTTTLTRIDLLFAIEETFWDIGFVSIIPMLIISLRKLSARRNMPAWVDLRQVRQLLIVIAFYCIVYILFEFGFGLPFLYWPGAIAQLHMPNPDPTFRFGIQALRATFLIVHPTRDLLEDRPR